MASEPDYAPCNQRVRTFLPSRLQRSFLLLLLLFGRKLVLVYLFLLLLWRLLPTTLVVNTFPDIEDMWEE